MHRTAQTVLYSFGVVACLFAAALVGRGGCAPDTPAAVDPRVPSTDTTAACGPDGYVVDGESFACADTYRD